jgi:hypothetical protein
LYYFCTFLLELILLHIFHIPLNQTLDKCFLLVRMSSFSESLLWLPEYLFLTWPVYMNKFHHHWMIDYGWMHFLLLNLSNILNIILKTFSISSSRFDRLHLFFECQKLFFLQYQCSVVIHLQHCRLSFEYFKKYFQKHFELRLNYIQTIRNCC